jgi:hypothetical protein
MYAIQKTTVSEIEGEKARIEIQISDEKDLEKSKQSVVLSVMIDRPKTAHQFESMQLRALLAANDLIDHIADEVEKSKPNR